MADEITARAQRQHDGTWTVFVGPRVTPWGIGVDVKSQGNAEFLAAMIACMATGGQPTAAQRTLFGRVFPQPE